MKKIISRIKGGLGNQLFCYATARRLALANDAELVIDHVTGFVRDQHRRRYALDHFHIPVRKAALHERLEPFERYRRGVMKWVSRRKAFADRRYIEQEGCDFDERLLTLKVKGTLYLDGLWQSESYFKDHEQTIREDLEIVPPKDRGNRQLAEDIRRKDAVAIHVRWFDPPETARLHNVSLEYYREAIALIERKLESPWYFVFSDDPEATRRRLGLADRATFVSLNIGEQNAYADLWLMSQCRHFVIANSTFSWWGAWLARRPGKTVVCPKVELRETWTAWNFAGQIPNSWLKV